MAPGHPLRIVGAAVREKGRNVMYLRSETTAGTFTHLAWLGFKVVHLLKGNWRTVGYGFPHIYQG